ncbi:hypothetical protein OsJ_11527 [Oryza sativa Japonica Group]|nr:hypothetical protein [Oryza sativa Japonica Group]ABF97264.1 hypothetical protein LOC_Os03g38040 [Oryza sativa Japonica Group]EAZ27578.1 hypothetical protein OsJ_11527 [Oryza sativa Japonica Group]
MGARAGALELLLLLGGRGGLLLLGRRRHGGRRAWWGWWRALRQRGKEARQREPRPGERRPAAGWPWALGAGTDALVDLMGDAVAEAGVMGACGGGRGGGGGRHSGGCGRVFLEETSGMVVSSAAGAGGDGGIDVESNLLLCSNLAISAPPSSPTIELLTWDDSGETVAWICGD